MNFIAGGFSETHLNEPSSVHLTVMGKGNRVKITKTIRSEGEAGERKIRCPDYSVHDLVIREGSGRIGEGEGGGRS